MYVIVLLTEFLKSPIEIIPYVRYCNGNVSRTQINARQRHEILVVSRHLLNVWVSVLLVYFKLRKAQSLTGEQRKPPNEELQILYPSPYIRYIKVKKK
jgi:hypothetical protein